MGFVTEDRDLELWSVAQDLLDTRHPSHSIPDNDQLLH